MLNQEKASIIFPIIFLFALIAGGVFVSNYWQANVYTSPQSIVEKEVDVARPSEILTKDEAEEELKLKIQILIQESEKLIAKTQEFIDEEKKKLSLIEEAKKKSSQIKGVYMTEFIANSRNSAGANIRNNIVNLLNETELNGIVIDIKEAYGPNLPNSLKNLINEFHQNDIWVIARIVAFRDLSLIEERPGWYLKTLSATTTATSTTSSEIFWEDSGGIRWLDPAGYEAQNYIIEFSKKAIDFGFDELQFDYIRFPSDGDLENIIYPFYDGGKKYEVMREFFSNLSEALKSYKPSIILSADLFGYVATQFQAFEIGQRLVDAVDTFDYISFMLYPSHFYGGFAVEEDPKRELPALYFPYVSEDINQVVSNNPYEVIYRSILIATDYISLFGAKAKIRPWLQDFDLKSDTERGIFYDAEKVRAQIKGAKDSGASGWLLWNPSNIYTKEAFEEIGK